MQPTVVGSGRRYPVSEILSEDALGTLWRGVDDRSGAAVCVRLLDERLTSDPAALHRVTSQLRRLQWRAASPHLAPLLHHDLRWVAGRQAVVVYGASGEPVARRLARGEALDVPGSLRLIAAVADGLASAHVAWIYHGALTASSVVVDQDGGVKVIDVGLGELLEEGEARRGPTLTDRGPADVLALAELFDRLVSGTAARPGEGEAERPWEADLPAEAATLLERSRSPHPRLRPEMAQLARELGRNAPSAETPGSRAPAVELELTPADWPAAPIVAPSVEPEAPAPIVAPSVEPEAPAPRVPPVREDRFVELPPSPRAPRRSRRLVAALAALVALAAVVGGALVLLGGGDAPPEAPSASVSASVVAPVERATVPDVLGHRVDEATQLLEQAGLTVGLVASVPGPDGEVVRTDPTPGEAVVAGRAVALFVGDGSQG